MGCRMYAVIFISLLVSVNAFGDVPGKDDVMENEPSGEYYDWEKTRKPERPWFLPYHRTLVTKIFLAEKLPNQGCKVHLTFEQALEVIRRLDNITLGIPKVVYLVGWQFNGHDSKYPAWSEVNHRLKRPGDPDALTSLKWLMEEGLKHHTIVSLHINMFDAYADSPLWKEYVEHDIIAKEKDGTPKKAEVHGPGDPRQDQSYPISYAREWDTGYAKKRIDGLLAMLPIQRAHTIHIDAFHPVVPMWQDKDYFSPYLDYTKADEVEAQRKIVRYWRDRGVDVTVESTYMAVKLIGLIPMAWHHGPVDGCPPTLLCGTPMQAENEIKRDPENLTGLLEQFCLNVVPWYYENNATVVKGKRTRTMREGDDICMPALWREKRTLVAYSRDGYESRTWELPPDWKDVRKVTLSRITLERLQHVGVAKVTPDGLRLKLGEGEALVIEPKD